MLRLCRNRSRGGGQGSGRPQGLQAVLEVLLLLRLLKGGPGTATSPGAAASGDPSDENILSTSPAAGANGNKPVGNGRPPSGRA